MRNQGTVKFRGIKFLSFLPGCRLPVAGSLVVAVACCLFLLAGCGGGGGGETSSSTLSSTGISITTVSIITDPKGMLVYLNDAYYGTTPLEGLTDLQPGVYTIKLVPPSGLETIASSKIDTFVVTKGTANNYYYLKDSESSVAQPPVVKHSTR